jgi:hypothetical protein
MGEGSTLLRALLVCLPFFVACGRPSRPEKGDAGNVASPQAVPASSAPSATAMTAPSASSVPPSAASPTLVVVWGVAPSGEAESFLLEWTGDKAQVLGKKAGAIVFAGGGLYRWRETTGKGHGLIDCDEAFNPGETPRPNNRFTFEIKGAKAERLDSRGEIEIETIPELEDMALYSNTVTLEASLGPYLFISNVQDSRHCLAAHGGGGVTYWVFELEKRAPSLFPTKGDEAILRAAASELPPEKTKPCADAVRESGSTEPQSLASMSLESVIPKWSKDGAFHFDVGFTIMLSHVGGVHDCGVEVSRMPASLVPFEPPAWLQKRPKKLETIELKGWSAVPAADSAAVDRVNRVFKVRANAKKVDTE